MASVVGSGAFPATACCPRAAEGRSKSAVASAHTVVPEINLIAPLLENGFGPSRSVAV
jgi:hypothetical protein